MLVAEVQACIEAHAMLPLGARVLVAVSGGADSTALLFALFHLRSVYDLTLIVVHVNHQLRGDESEQEAHFVAQQATRLALPFYQARVDVKALQRRARLSLQQAARQLRYHCLHTFCHTLQATRVALGHTADDQAETLLMRLLRGSGPASLAGMPAVRLPFIRPLITTSRRTIQAYLQAEGLPWVEDSSNASPAYLRNRVRLDLLPKLQQYNPRIAQHLNELAVMLQADNRVLEQQVDTWAAHACAWQAPQRVEIRCACFGSAPVALQRRLLRRLADALSSTPADVSFRHIEGLRQFIISESHGQHWVLPGRVRAERQRDTVLLWSEDSVPVLPSDLTLTVPGSLYIAALNLRLQADIVDLPCTLERTPPHRAYLDLDRTGERLQVRFCRPGDRFYPLGAPGAKKLHDFFVDSKIRRAQRPYVPLVVSGRDIVWVVGYRIAEPFKIRPETRRVVCLQSSAVPGGMPDEQGHR